MSTIYAKILKLNIYALEEQKKECGRLREMQDGGFIFVRNGK